jgi:SSS family transporter
MYFDIAVIAFYIIGINIIGLTFGKSSTVSDYFLGNRSISWPVVCLSIVATETSSLTFISIPGLAYITNLGFLQIAAGYILGRVLVAFFLLPKYFAGNYDTAYQLLRARFGAGSQRIISIVFHITRLLADSVRLFATAIPVLLLMTKAWGEGTFPPFLLLVASIIVIGLATFIYTYFGGLTSVAVVDNIQLFVYILSAVLGLIYIFVRMDMPLDDFMGRISPEKLVIFSTGFSTGMKGLLSTYNIFSGLIGGMLLSFASHGTDHLMVQRILACRDLRSGQKAMIVSGFVVFVQFFLFMMLGMFIHVLLEGKAFDIPDKIMSYFIVNYAPPGLRGLMLAGIFAAAMSTLASSINSLSSSTAIDILRIQEKGYSDEKQVALSKKISLVWTCVIMLIASMFMDIKNPLVEIGLGIASVTYGGMLGIFIMGIAFKSFNEKAALGGVLASIAVLAAVVLMNSMGVVKIFWPWFVPMGLTVSLAVGCLLNYFAGQK